MPVIAESPPLVFGQSTPTPSPSQTPSPTHTPSPTSAPTQAPTPSPSTDISGFKERHRLFILKTEQLGSCFKRENMPEFSNKDFEDHVDIAISDKYLAQTGDTYCNMQGIHKLVGTIKRTQNEQEIIG